MQNKTGVTGNDTEATVHSSDDMSTYLAEQMREKQDLKDAEADIERSIEEHIERTLMESLDVSIVEILTVLDTPKLHNSSIKEKRDSVMVFLETRVPCQWIQDYYRGPLHPCV